MKRTDISPQKSAFADGLAKDLFQVVIFMTGIASVTSETLREYGIAIDLEPSHPKMGFLVRETAEQSAQLMRRKRRMF